MLRAAPAFLLALGGCFLAETFRPLSASSSDWYEVGPIRKPLAEIVEAARTYLVRAGYAVAKPDPGARALETEWDTHLSSHWREGFRTKVEVEFPEQPDGSTLVRIRSYREVNNEQVSPMLENKARWIGASSDDKQAPLIPEPAIRLRQQLKVRFFGLSE